MTLLNELGKQLLQNQDSNVYKKYLGSFNSNQVGYQNDTPIEATPAISPEPVSQGVPTIPIPDNTNNTPIGDIPMTDMIDWIYDPDALANAKLFQREDGTWHTDNPYANMTLNMESYGGKANAGSPTGALGLYQFTKGTGKQYGLLTDEDRLDPYKNHQAFVQLTRDNARMLQNYKIPVNPFYLYVAHNLGIGNAQRLYKYSQGIPLSDKELSGLKKAIGLQGMGFDDPNAYVSTFNKKINSNWRKG